MPFVLQHQGTKQIYSCMLVNHYDLPYYGVMNWQDEAGVSQFLRSGEINHPEVWKPVEITQSMLKSCNVKLKNDPRLRLFWQNNTITIES